MSEKIQPLTMPQWGLTMTEGTLVKWNAKEGDKISEKSEIAEIETEKIVNVLESPTSGVIKKLITPEGEMRGTALKGPCAFEAAERWPRIANLASIIV